MNLAELVETILKHRRLYEAGKSVISDLEFDRLEEELRKRVPDHPALQSVGTVVLEEGKKVQHHPPMLSLEKTYKVADLVAWTEGRRVVGTMKIDGVAMSLSYRDRRLVQAKTRGNGHIGEDCSEKIAWVSACPQYLTECTVSDLEVRGELFCRQSRFSLLLAEMESLGLERPSSPRNIVAGVLGRKQHFELARYFDFFAYDALPRTSKEGSSRESSKEGSSRENCAAGFPRSSSIPWSSEWTKLQCLQNLGFATPESQLLQSEKAIGVYLEHVKSTMADDEIGIDGAVFTFDDLSLHEALGSTSHHPRYKLSFKWAGQTATVEIRDIHWMTSRLGIVTPVAVINPVFLSGAQISNVTLHNAAYVRLFNLKSGDQIEIVRSGEVIPKFLRVVQEGHGRSSLPESCPSCQGPLSFDEVRLKCGRSSNCPAQFLGTILNWVSYADIEDLSVKRVQAMVELKLIKQASDLYQLSIEDLLTLPLTKEKMAKKLWSRIQQSRDISLVSFLCGLGVSGLGRASWGELLDHFPSLEALFAASIDDITSVKGFADKSAVQIYEGLREKRPEIENLLAAGVRPRPYVQKAPMGSLAGLSFVITGALSRPREEIVSLLSERGAKVSTSVSQNLTALITDDPESNSAKAKKARELNIPFWSEEQLFQYIAKRDSQRNDGGS